MNLQIMLIYSAAAGGMNTFAFLEFKYANDAASAANTAVSFPPCLNYAYTD
jgi:hypothetical protein